MAETIVGEPGQSGKKTELNYSLRLSLLGSIPLELRCMIFTPLLVLEEGSWNEEFLNPTNRWTPRRNRESIYPAILRVCRQFLVEGRVLLYSKNSFHFDNPRDVIGFSYVQQRSLNTRLVTSLHLSFRIGHMQDIHDLLLLLECGHFKKEFPFPALKTLDIEFIGIIDDASFTMIDEALRRENLRAKKVWIIGAGKRGGLLMDALSEPLSGWDVAEVGVTRVPQRQR